MELEFCCVQVVSQGNCACPLWVCVCEGCGGVCAFVNTLKGGHTLLMNNANVDTPPTLDVLSFLLCPGDRK